MHHTCDWTGFYLALCERGPHLLRGIDGDDGIREVIVLLASDTDTFWSDGLQPLLVEGGAGGNLRTGVLAALELWRENVLVALSDNFSIELDWDEVTIDASSPLVDELIEAATP